MIEQIKLNPVYQQVLKDSTGGIIYDASNQHKYDAAEIIEMWDNLPPDERQSAGGIMEGAFNFLKGK